MNSQRGRVVTFYSYKGGTGRSMALANVAWVLASSGLRVLMIDWDLEAPGLHKYFAPFLDDPELKYSDGLIDFVIDYADEASQSPPSKDQAQPNLRPEPWLSPRANLLRFAVPVLWEFPDGGRIDFVPSGRQGPSYSTRVNSFEWAAFYERLHGGQFLEHVATTMRSKYDFILVDSRTGVSDTAGICTVQLPDVLVVLFTLNNQSMSGASAVARSATAQRGPDRPLQVLPVPTRIDPFEKERLETARARAQALFDSQLSDRFFAEREDYWSAVEIPYEAFYAYDEILAIFAEQGSNSIRSLLGSAERLAQFIYGKKIEKTDRIPERRRREVVAQFNQPAYSDLALILDSLASQYERLRQDFPSGSRRTRMMDDLVRRVAVVAQGVNPSLANELFDRGKDGTRVVALGLIESGPEPNHLELALRSIREPRSPFEQFHALLIAQALFDKLEFEDQEWVREAIQSQIPHYINSSDQSRWVIAQRMLRRPTPSHSLK